MADCCVHRGLPVPCLIALTLLMLLAWAACGGGAGVTHMPGTTAAPYTLTLTATDPVASLTETITANLTVSQQGCSRPFTVRWRKVAFDDTIVASNFGIAHLTFDRMAKEDFQVPWKSRPQ